MGIDTLIFNFSKTTRTGIITHSVTVYIKDERGLSDMFGIQESIALINIKNCNNEMARASVLIIAAIK